MTRIGWARADRSRLSVIDPPPVPVSPEWTTLRFIVTAPDDAAYLSGQTRTNNDVQLAVGDTFDATALSIVDITGLDPDLIPGADEPGWVWQGQVVAVDSAAVGAADGPGVWSVTAGSYPDPSNTFTLTQPAVAAGGTYTASVFLRPSRDVIVRTVAAGSQVDPVETYLPAGSWTRVSGTGVLDAGDPVVLSVHVEDVLDAGDVLEASAALVERSGVVGSYFTGWTRDLPQEVNSWTGTAGFSTSTQTLPSATGTTTLGSGAGPSGTTSYQHTVVGVPNVRGGSGPQYMLLRDSAAGATYTASLWVRASGHTQVQLVVQGLDVAGAVVASVVGDVVSPSVGAWTQLGPLTATFPVAAAAVVVRAVTLSGATPQVRTNLAFDPQGTTTTVGVAGGPGFTTGRGFGAAGAAAPVMGVTDGPFVGITSYARWTWSAAAPAGAHGGWELSNASGNVLPVSDGGTYAASLWVRSSRAHASGRLVVSFLNASGGIVGTEVVGAAVPVPAGVWTNLSLLFGVPAGANRALIYQDDDVSGAVAGDHLDATGLLVERAHQVGGYFSGQSPSSFDWAYAWTGTANRSTSTATSQVAGALPAGAALDAGSVQIFSGSSPTAVSMGRVDYIGQTNTSHTQLPATAGVAYAFSVHEMASRHARGRLVVTWYTSGGAAIGSQVLSGWVDLPPRSWQLLSVVATAPATTAYVQVDAYADAAGSGADLEVHAGDQLWFADALMEQSPSVLGFFDGSFTDSPPGSVFDWVGTADASVSTLSSSVPVDPTPVLDPDCAVVPAAPRPDPIDVSCLDTPSQWIRYDALVPASQVPVWRDAVAIVRITTAAVAARQVRFRFYPNEFTSPIEALDACGFCGEFVVSYIPAHSTLTIDGIRRTAHLVAAGATAQQPASHLLYGSDGGPMTWPELTCGIAYTAVLDVSPASVVGLTADACIAARE